MDGSHLMSGPGRRRVLGALGSLGALLTLPSSGCSSGVRAPAPRSPDAAPRPEPRRAPTTRPLLIGTYTSVDGGGEGVGLATYHSATGRITGKGTLTDVPDPSYLAVHPSGRTVYAANERERGMVTAIELAPDGKATVLNSRPSGGSGPAHLSVHPSGRWLLTANYLSGSVAVHPIERSGALADLTDQVTHSEPPPGPGQDGPHAHQFAADPDGRHLLAVDLGTDTVYSYRLDTGAGRLRQVARATVRPGAGPRHLTFHPSGRHAYLANELDNTVTVCGYDPATGRLTPGDPQPTGTGSGTNYPAQLVVTPDGGYAYLANRGHNSLTRYATEAGGARLRLLDTVPVEGDFPRHIALSPDGGLLFAANQKSGSVSVFHVNKRTGQLRLTEKPFRAPVAVCALPL